MQLQENKNKISIPFAGESLPFQIETRAGLVSRRIGGQGWKRHYPLLLLIFLQVAGTFFCVADLYGRQKMMAEQNACPEVDGCAYTALDACGGAYKESSFCFLSFLPDTCEGMPLSL